MKISALILQLEEWKHRHGDLNVTIRTTFNTSPAEYEVAGHGIRRVKRTSNGRWVEGIGAENNEEIVVFY